MKNTLLIIITVLCALVSCKKPEEVTIDKKAEMKGLIVSISKSAKQLNPNFIVIPQNGLGLITDDGTASSPISQNYLDAIDGQSQEDYLYGYNGYNQATPANETANMKSLLDKAKDNLKKILITNYTNIAANINSIELNCAADGYISYSAPSLDLDIINTSQNIYNKNFDSVNNLITAKNYLYILNYQNYTNKETLLEALVMVDYDVIIMDAFFSDGIAFTQSDIQKLKVKSNGNTRKVISYISIGEAENYRYYWEDSWNSSKPSFIGSENKDWAGNYAVEYWDTEWKNIIYNGNNSYISQIVNAGFDGVLLDKVDAFEE